MAEQTVSTRLSLDASEFKREAQASAKVFDKMAGSVQGAGSDIDKVFTGMTDSAGKAEDGVRSLDARLGQLTGADREVLIEAEVSRAEADIRRIDAMLQDPSLTDPEIRIALDGRNQAKRQIEELKDELDELGPAAKEAGEEIERGLDLKSLGGALGSAGAASSIDSAVTSTGRLRAQLGLTAEEVKQFDDVSKEVYRNNFGESLGEATQVTGHLHQALKLTGDELESGTTGVFAIRDAFDHLGADVDTTVNATRTLSANFKDLDPAGALDLIARGFQSGAGSAGDLLDVLQEYPGDFARIGLDAEDMVGIINAGLDAGAWNADRVGDSVRELGIRISTAGDAGQEALYDLFPESEADRLIEDFNRGGEAGRQAFFSIIEAIDATEDPNDRYNAQVAIMGTLGEELANQFPEFAEALRGVGDGAEIAGTGVEGLNTQYDGFRNTLEGVLRDLETSALGKLGDVGIGFADVAANAGIAILGFKGIKDVLPGMNGGLGNTARTLGPLVGRAGLLAGAAVGTALLADSLLELVGVRPQDLSNIANELEILARTGQGDFNLDQIADALDHITDPSLYQSFEGSVDKIGGKISTLGGLLGDDTSDFADWRRLIEETDASLAAMVSSGNADLAATAFDQIATAAEEAGVPLSRVTDALPDYAAALDLAGARAGEGVADMLGFSGAVGFVNEALAKAPGPVNDLTEGLTEQEEQILETVQGWNDLSDALRAQFDPLFAAQDATMRLKEAQDKATWAAAEFGEESIEAADANRELARAALDNELAQIDLRRAVENGDVSLTDAKATLQRWVAEGAITEEAARQMGREFDVVAWKAAELDGSSVYIPVRLDTTQWLKDISAFYQQNPGIPVSLGLGGQQSFAAGGLVEDPLYMASGGPSGTDTVPAWLTPGEFVIRAPAVAALGLDTMHALNRADQMAAAVPMGQSYSNSDNRSTVVNNYYPVPEPASRSLARSLRKASTAMAES